MESENSSIEVGSGKYRYRVVRDWPQLPDGVSFEEVVAVATDSQGKVHVFNRGRHPIVIFEPEGQCIGTFEAGPFARPHGITIGPDDSVYCCDDHDHTVKVFSSDGRPRFVIGTSGQHSDTGAESIDYRKVKRSGLPFNYPTNLAIAPSGDLYVADGYGNARVHRFSAQGELLESWGDPGDGPGQFRVPHGIAVDLNSIVYVADRENSRVQRFDSQGGFIDQWTDVARPAEVFIDDEGTVYVAELGYRAGRWPGWPAPPDDAVGGRLSIFDAHGALLARWGGGKRPCDAGDFFAPHDVWVDAAGDIYVSEVVLSAGANKGLVSPDCHTVQKFSRIRDTSS